MRFLRAADTVAHIITTISKTNGRRGVWRPSIGCCTIIIYYNIIIIVTIGVRRSYPTENNVIYVYLDIILLLRESQLATCAVRTS